MSLGLSLRFDFFLFFTCSLFSGLSAKFLRVLSIASVFVLGLTKLLATTAKLVYSRIIMALIVDSPGVGGRWCCFHLLLISECELVEFSLLGANFSRLLT